MNSVIEQPGRAERHRDSIMQCVRRFNDDARADHLHGSTFDTVPDSRWASRLPRRVAFWRTVILARHPQKVASDIARKLYRGYFGNAAGFDAVALEVHHGGR